VFNHMKREEKEETAKRMKQIDDYYRTQLKDKINETNDRTKKFL
jgi:hypothetical protein